MSEYMAQELKHHLNTHVDVAPPWTKYPTYERYTIGWRMGGGEDYIHLWHAYVGTLDSRDALLTHLRRHGPAPMTWGDMIGWQLNPDADHGEPPPMPELVDLGLVASDAALDQFAGSIARGDQREPVWSWSESLEQAARYLTRELWLHARHHHERVTQRALLTAADLSPAWAHTIDALNTGALPELDPDQGLATLAIACAANRVPGPWELGMNPGDFQDTFDMDMNYADAYCLWLMSCIDDRAQLDMLLGADGVPDTWRSWLDEQLH